MSDQSRRRSFLVSPSVLSGVRKLLLQYYILYSLTAGWNSVEDKLENLGKLQELKLYCFGVVKSKILFCDKLCEGKLLGIQISVFFCPFSQAKLLFLLFVFFSKSKLLFEDSLFLEVPMVCMPIWYVSLWYVLCLWYGEFFNYF